MKFFSTKVEATLITWDVHSVTEHSVLSVNLLGLNEAGWIMLRFNPRYDKNATMAKAVKSSCINMANPDEESGLIGKSSRFSKVDDTNSAIVEAEDINDLLNHLSSCNCITKEDAQLIAADINKLAEGSLENSTTSTKTLPHLHDENLSKDQGQNFVH